MKIVVSIVAATILILLGAGGWFNGVINHPADPKETSYRLIIAKGSGVTDIGEKLRAAGYITSTRDWQWYIALAGLRSSLLNTAEFECKSDMAVVGRLRKSYIFPSLYSPKPTLVGAL